MIFNIQRYATHDGPGVRTAVFLKGCSLKCSWCQNPESISRTQDLFYDQRLCIKDCERCCSVSPAFVKDMQSNLVSVDRKILNKDIILLASDACPSGALETCGKSSSIDEVVTTILKDKPFYESSGGGVTITGGEPFMQHDFTFELLTEVKKHSLHTAVESCLHVPWKYISKSVDLIDLWLLDIKHVDHGKFNDWTNGQLDLINQNYDELGKRGANIVFRVPIIPGFNDDETTLLKIIDKAADHYSKFGGSGEIHFLPYHTYGVHKYHLLGVEYSGAKQSLECPELLAFLEEKANSRGLTAIMRG